MKALAALAALAGAGLVVSTAAGDPVPLPPVPTVTVSVPPLPVPGPVPVPLPVIPKLPAPAVPASAVPTPAAAAPAAAALSQASAAAQGTSGSPGTDLTGSPSAGGSSSGASSGSSRSARVQHFHSSRTWIATTGPKGRRTTVLTFVLPSAARVILTVNQLSPSCVGIGRFSVAGHAGLNRVRFAGRVHGRALAPGTYRISARTASGRLVRRITLVVVSASAPTRADLQSLRAANACRASSRRAAALSGATSAGAAPLPTQQLPRPLSQPEQSGTGLSVSHGPNLHSGVLASTVEKTARALQPVLVALLALAIVLLGVASLPGVAVAEPRVNYLLAQHRLEIAGLGAAALIGVVLAFLLA